MSKLRTYEEAVPRLLRDQARYANDMDLPLACKLAQVYADGLETGFVDCARRIHEFLSEAIRIEPIGDTQLRLHQLADEVYPLTIRPS